MRAYMKAKYALIMVIHVYASGRQEIICLCQAYLFADSSSQKISRREPRSSNDPSRFTFDPANRRTEPGLRGGNWVLKVERGGFEIELGKLRAEPCRSRSRINHDFGSFFLAVSIQVSVPANRQSSEVATDRGQRIQICLNASAYFTRKQPDLRDACIPLWSPLFLSEDEIEPEEEDDSTDEDDD
ncbi:hypothetical protein EVAR_48635_1 [Eumeta japonica]|uniref:Uncharacterized protein n=1 Tax=Eumeta variegata TaxID=151549 RepID=A0A4C1XNU4_EUMVA|nr:hypothetical protein EVAR_48635_1 [Eumeta japonica]